MALPVSVQANIIQYLPRFPDRLRFKLVNRYLDSLIPPLNDQELYFAGRSSFVGANPPQAFWDCTSCGRLRPFYNFEDSQRQRRRTIRSKRSCIDCQIASGHFKFGDLMVWQQRFRIFCDDCGEFPASDLRKFFGLCERCWQASGDGSRFQVDPWVSEQLAREESNVKAHHRIKCLHCES